MGECNGCPDYTRRIEVYSNKDTGCGTEFFIENNNNDNGGNDGGNSNNNGGNDGGNVAPAAPAEEGASQIILGSATFAAAAIMALY